MSVWTWLAAGSAAAAVVVRWPGRDVLLRHRLGGRRGEGGPRAVSRSAPQLPGPLVAGLGVVAVLLVDGPLAIVVGVVAGVALFVLRGFRIARERARVRERRDQVAGALDLLAGELRAGVLPHDALLAVAAEAPVLADVAVSVRSGGDVAVTLRGSAARPGAEALDDLAAAWHVAERAGAPLSSVLDRVAVGLRDELEAEREAAAEAAPARATGRLMAGLPVLGLGLGAGLGADPVHVLTATVPGALCLAAGAVLACLGTWWVDRVADSAGVGRVTS